ncbi:hypothetical protein BGZ91_006647 [Linnemannia elongata]|nr:hypothetical protein BGZ91_006647 [Linnemannia elongata]
MDSIAAMNKKSLQRRLKDRVRAQKVINRNTSTIATNHSQNPECIEKGVLGPTRTSRDRVKYSSLPTHVVHPTRTSAIAPAATPPKPVTSESKWAPPLPNLEAALAGPPFLWIPAPDVHLRLKMAFRTLAEYNDLREEALMSPNPRPQCVRRLYILVKKHYYPSA